MLYTFYVIYLKQQAVCEYDIYDIRVYLKRVPHRYCSSAQDKILNNPTLNNFFFFFKKKKKKKKTLLPALLHSRQLV